MVIDPAPSSVCAELWFSSCLCWKRDGGLKEMDEGDGDGKNDAVANKRQKLLSQLKACFQVSPTL